MALSLHGIKLCCFIKNNLSQKLNFQMAYTEEEVKVRKKAFHSRFQVEIECVSGD